MVACRHCGRVGLRLRATPGGLCRKCREEIGKSVKEELDRVKQALVFARYLKDPVDKVLHLRRAMDGVRALARYERLGYVGIRPTPEVLASLVEGKLEDLQAEQGDLGGTESIEAAGSGVQPVDRSLDRRRVRRERAGYLVRVGESVRALTEDVSSRGIRIRMPRFERPGTRLRFTLHAPEGAVRTEGVVRWAQPVRIGGENTTHAVLGVEFQPGAVSNHV